MNRLPKRPICPAHSPQPVHDGLCTIPCFISMCISPAASPIIFWLTPTFLSACSTLLFGHSLCSASRFLQPLVPHFLEYLSYCFLRIRPLPVQGYILPRASHNSEGQSEVFCQHKRAFHTHFILIYCLSLQLLIIYIYYVHKMLVLHYKIHLLYKKWCKHYWVRLQSRWK